MALSNHAGPAVPLSSSPVWEIGIFAALAGLRMRPGLSSPSPRRPAAITTLENSLQLFNLVAVIPSGASDIGAPAQLASEVCGDVCFPGKGRAVPFEGGFRAFAPRPLSGLSSHCRKPCGKETRKLFLFLGEPLLSTFLAVTPLLSKPQCMALEHFSTRRTLASNWPGTARATL